MVMLSGLLASFIATKLGKMLPSWAWEIVIAALLVGAGMLAHHVAVVKHDNGVRAAQKASDDKSWQAKLDGLNAKIRAQDAQNAAMADKLRKANDEEHNRIAADAGTLLVRGPGRATCPRVPNAAPTSGGHVAPAAVGGTAGSGLPSSDSAAVPWSWLVHRSQEHDDLLANEKAWRQWYDNLVKAWPKAK